MRFVMRGLGPRRLGRGAASALLGKLQRRHRYPYSDVQRLVFATAFDGGFQRGMQLAEMFLPGPPDGREHSVDINTLAAIIKPKLDWPTALAVDCLHKLDEAAHRPFGR